MFIKNNTKVFGFTLAEVLITLLIIGVVASLVIPALINNTNKAEYITKLKKEYAVLSQAFNMVKMNAGGSILNSSLSNTTDDSTEDVAALDDLAKYLNFTKNCGTALGCWYPSPLKMLDGTDYAANKNVDTWWGTVQGKAILADGSIIKINIRGNSCTYNLGAGTAGTPLDHSICGDIWIDVNGAVGPNTIGKDVFTFWITKTGIYPYGTFGDGYITTCVTSSSGFGCTQKVLTDGTMNY